METNEQLNPKPGSIIFPPPPAPQPAPPEPPELVNGASSPRIYPGNLLLGSSFRQPWTTMLGHNCYGLLLQFDPAKMQAAFPGLTWQKFNEIDVALVATNYKVHYLVKLRSGNNYSYVDSFSSTPAPLMGAYQITLYIVPHAAVPLNAELRFDIEMIYLSDWNRRGCLQQRLAVVHNRGSGAPVHLVNP
jgi:hypothetical protein